MLALKGVRRYLDWRHRKQLREAGGGGPGAAMAAAAAAATGSAGMAAVAQAAAGGGVAAREAVGTVGDVTIGGGVVAESDSDEELGEDSKVAVGTVAEFKRKVRLGRWCAHTHSMRHASGQRAYLRT